MSYHKAISCCRGTMAVVHHAWPYRYSLRTALPAGRVWFVLQPCKELQDSVGACAGIAGNSRMVVLGFKLSRARPMRAPEWTCHCSDYNRMRERHEQQHAPSPPETEQEANSRG